MDIVDAYQIKLIVSIIFFTVAIIYIFWSSSQVPFGGEIILLMGLIMVIPVGFFIYELYSLSYGSAAYEYVQKHKPACFDDSVDCITKKINWYRDSATYAPNLDSIKYVKDSLRNELLKYEGNK